MTHCSLTGYDVSTSNVVILNVLIHVVYLYTLINIQILCIHLVDHFVNNFRRIDYCVNEKCAYFFLKRTVPMRGVILVYNNNYSIRIVLKYYNNIHENTWKKNI